MDVGVVTDITAETLYTVIITAAPMLLVSLIVGLGVSIFQTVTSIQEQTLTFVPKFLAIFISIMVMGHWMLNNITGLMEKLWNDFALYIR